MADLNIEVPAAGDLSAISTWISDSGEVALISDLPPGELPIETLSHWLDTSVSAAAVRVDGALIAFATVSIEEAHLPEGTAEICHLIVHPKWRRRYNGSHIVLELALRARELGFSSVMGRVVPNNVVAHKFLSSLGWSQADPWIGWAPGFSWQMRPLNNV